VVAGALRRGRKPASPWVDYVTKGHNPWTEHYSRCRPTCRSDRSQTPLNTRLNPDPGNRRRGGAVGPGAGRTASANTVRDIADYWSENVRKLVLIEDTSSPGAGFRRPGSPIPRRPAPAADENRQGGGIRMLNASDDLPRRGNTLLLDAYYTIGRLHLFCFRSRSIHPSRLSRVWGRTDYFEAP